MLPYIPLRAVRLTFVEVPCQDVPMVGDQAEVVVVVERGRCQSIGGHTFVVEGQVS